MQMLAMILANVPVWVWAILAFVIVMGLRLSREQHMSRGRLMLVPAIWLVYGAWGVENSFGLAAAPLLAWATGLATSVALVRRSGWASQARVQAGLYVVPGSWVPLALMLSIFCAKFALGMGLAMNPALAHQTSAAVGFSVLFGLLGGAFLGRSLNILGASRHDAQPVFA